MTKLPQTCYIKVLIVIEPFPEMRNAVLKDSSVDLDGLFRHMRVQETSLGK